MSNEIGFSLDEWTRVREDYTAWWRGDLDRALVRLVLDSRPGEEMPSRFLPNWPKDLSDDAFMEIVTRKLSRERYYGDAMPYFQVNFGPGVAAAFAGAGVRPTPETVWFERLEHNDIRDLRIRFNQQNPWWLRVQHVTRLLAGRIGEHVQISITDIGGNMDILAALRGTSELLMDVVEQPEEVERCCAEITRMWVQTYDALHPIVKAHCPGTIPWAIIWAPGRCYMLQCDFSAMISPAMYKRFVVPDIEACCARLDHSFYHLDGAQALVHLPQLCAIKNLQGIQWVPGAGAPEAAKWPQVLDNIREAGKLCQVFATPQGALEIVKRHGGKGFLFNMDATGLTDASARTFLSDMKSAQARRAV